MINAHLSDFFNFIVKASVHNFADDISLSSIAESIEDLVKSLELESKVAIDWFSLNNMVGNPGKSQAMIIDKGKRDPSNETLDINNETAEAG